MPFYAIDGSDHDHSQMRESCIRVSNGTFGLAGPGGGLNQKTIVTGRVQ